MQCPLSHRMLHTIYRCSIPCFTSLFCSRAGIAPGNAFTFTGNRYLCAFNYKCLAIMENYICFTFHLRNRVMLETVRGKFGALLRSLHLRYRSESEFLPYRDLSNPRVRPWRLDFSMLPPEYQQDNHLEILRHLKESYLPRLKAAHPEWGDVAIYRNLHLYPNLIHSMSDWWR